jgi:class 3 adenylate cyclase
VKSTGDGYLATFDGPARAIGCAEDLIDELRGCGIEIRAGIHTGEVEIIGDDIGGMAVHLAARVNALADAGEILASRTVRDLVVGSGVAFTDRGEHELKGVPGRWDLVAVAPKGVAAAAKEAEIAEIETPNARDNLRTRDRMAVSMARRAPGVMRTLNRLTTKG